MNTSALEFGVYLLPVFRPDVVLRGSLARHESVVCLDGGGQHC